MESVKRTQRAYRSPLREEAARRTREAVLEAAAQVFLDEGYAGATIEQIAARAGVSRPTVFGAGSKAQGRLLAEFAAFTAAISQRLGPLQRVLEQAAGTDRALARRGHDRPDLL
jgi:AcrR family transcriptional regulator